VDVFSTGWRQEVHLVTKSLHQLLLMECTFPPLLFLHCRPFSFLYGEGESMRESGYARFTWKDSQVHLERIPRFTWKGFPGSPGRIPRFTWKGFPGSPGKDVHQSSVCVCVCIECYLEQPVASSVERGKYRGVHIAAVDALDALNLQLHVVLTSRLTISTLLPAVTVLAVTSFLTIVQQHQA